MELLAKGGKSIRSLCLGIENLVVEKEHCLAMNAPQQFPGPFIYTLEPVLGGFYQYAKNAVAENAASFVC